MASFKEEDVLTGFILISLICHGMFFLREWIVLGCILLCYRILEWVKEQKSIHFLKNESPTPAVPQKENNCVWRTAPGLLKMIIDPKGIFVLLILFSLLGLRTPVRGMEGWLEALKWGVFLAAYLWGKKIASSPESKEKIVQRIVLFSLIVTCVSLLPCSGMIWASPGPPEQGRFSLSFGYPNAAAVFLGCQLILLERSKRVNGIFLLVFFSGLVYTGSRAAFVLAVIFWLIVIGKKTILNWKTSQAVCLLGLTGYKLEDPGKKGQDYSRHFDFLVMVSRFPV